MKTKIYNQAPLPFQGQKRNMLKYFKEALRQYGDECVFVDLFGGSGLLSHIAKREKPNSTVIYNDFDNYVERLNNIERTNGIVAKIRAIAGVKNRKEKISDANKEAVIEILKEAEKTGFVDYLTIAANLLFSGKTAKTLNELTKHGFYNRITKTQYECKGYIDGLTITNCDYKELFNRYKDIPNVVFILDPPYLSTDCSTYNNQYWKLADYLDILHLLQNQKFLYFTSSKSKLVELLEWLKTANFNLLSGTQTISVKSPVNHISMYEDILIYKY